MSRTRPSPDPELRARSEQAGMDAGFTLLEAAQPAALRAGAAQVELPLPAGSLLGGYLAQPPRRSRAPGAVHLVCVVLGDGAKQVALFGIDAATVTPHLHALLRAAVPAEVAMVTTATHCHNGPGGIGASTAEALFFGPRDDALCARLVEAWRDCFELAVGRQQEARLALGLASAPALVRNRSEAGAPVDSVLSLLQLQGRSGDPIARLLAFPAHPTLSEERGLLSGDYPQALRDSLARDAAAVPTLFSPSASGSAGAPNLDVADPVKAMGEQLAELVRKIEAEPAPGPATRLAHHRALLPLPPAKIPAGSYGSLREVLSTGGGPPALPVDLILVGEVLIAVAPGEISAEALPALRHDISALGLHLLPLAHNGAYGGYLLPPERQQDQGPESYLEIYGPGGFGLFHALLRAAAEQIAAAR